MISKNTLTWLNGSKIAPQIGMRVLCGKIICRIKVLYSDIPGGVQLDRKVENFHSWNIDSLIPLLSPKTKRGIQ